MRTPSGRTIDQEILAQLGELWILADRRVQLTGHALQLLFLGAFHLATQFLLRQILFGLIVHQVARRHAEHDIGMGHRRRFELAGLLRGVPAAEAAASDHVVLDVGGGHEEVGDAELLLLGRGGEQPEEQEERHHRRRKVGVGDFPGAGVVRSAVALLDFLDQDRCVGLGRHRRRLRAWAPP